MSEPLRIGRDSNFYLGGNLINTQEIKNVNEYLMSFLNLHVILEDGITLGELIHSVFGLKNYISAYHLEEYEVLRAFTNIGKFNKRYKALVFSKSFTVESEELLSEENNYLFITPVIDLLDAEAVDISYEKIGDIPVVINENMKLAHNEINLILKTKFTLQDVITCLYEEVLYKLKNDNVISYAI